MSNCPANSASTNRTTDGQVPLDLSAHVRSTLTSNSYSVCSLIHHGGTASVYKVVSLKTGTVLAAKILPPGQSSELAIVSRLSHSNVVCLHCILVTSLNESIILTEYSHIGDLAGYIATLREPQLNNARKLFADIARGMAYMHSLGISHGDLKLENVLVFEEPSKSPPLQRKVLQAKLTDFGNSTICINEQKEVILSTTWYGRIEFAAPEQMIIDRPFNPMMADIFAAGVILYLLTTHHFPFGHGSQLEEKEGQQKLHAKITAKKWPHCAVYADDKLESLLCQLLNPVVSERITARQILEHAWLEMIN